MRLVVLFTIFYFASAKHILQFNEPGPGTKGAPPTNISASAPQTTLRFAVVLDNYTAASEVTAQEIYDGYRFWEHTVNNISGGITVGSKTLKVELIFRINPAKENATAYNDTLKSVIAQANPDFILGGDTRHASQDAAIAQEAERIAMLCCHGPPVVYNDSAALAVTSPANSSASTNRLFGIHVSSELYTDKLIRNIVVNKKAKKIAFVVTRNEVNPTEPLFTVTTCQAAVRELEEIKWSKRYDPVPKYGEIDLIQGRNTSEYFDELAQKIKDDPEYDIIVGCTLNFDGRMLLEALSRNSVPAKAVFITVAPTNQGTVKSLTSSNVTMNYVMSAGQWHPELNFGDSNRTAVWSTATDFAHKFENYTKEISSVPKAVTYTHASAAAAAYAIQLAIEAAFKYCNGLGEDVDVRQLLDSNPDSYCEDELNLTGYERILTELRILDRETFFGAINFDPFTQRNIGRDAITLQLLGQTPGTKTRSLKIFESINFGYDAVNANEFGNQTQLELIQEVVLPSEYGTSDMVLPRPPREGEPDRCLDGEGLDSMNECEVCELGNARAAFTGIFSCVECNYTSYMPLKGQKECLKCPDGTSAPTVGSTSLNDCVCMPGFYNDENKAGLECKECPDGATCAGGTESPVAKFGFWIDNSTMTPMSCSPSSACINKPNQTCAEGWGGPICSLCGWENGLPFNNDYFYVFGSCIDCKSKAVNFFAFAAVMLAWLIINLGMAEQLESLALVIDWMQLMNLVGSINAGWPDSLQQFFSIAQFFAFEVDIVSLRCLNPSWNFFWDMVVQFSIPIVTVVIMISWLYATPFLRKIFFADDEEPTAEGSDASNASPALEDMKRNSSKDEIGSTSSSSSQFKLSPRQSTNPLAFAAAIKIKAKKWVRRGIVQEKKRKEKRTNLVDEVLKRVFNIFEITYLASTQYGMAALRGVTVAGQKVVERAPYTPQTPLIVAVGAVGLAVFGVAFPMVVILMMWSWSPDCPFRKSPALPQDRYASYKCLTDASDSKTLEIAAHEEDPGGFLNKHNRTRLGWLYEKFRIEVYYMAAMHLAHRFVFAATVTLIVNPAMQLLISLIITALFAAWFLLTRPYFSSRLNVIQAVMYASIMVQLGIGICYYGRSFTDRFYDFIIVVSFALIGLVAAVLLWIVIIDWLEWRCARKVEARLEKRFTERKNEEMRRRGIEKADKKWRDLKREEWKAVQKLIGIFTPSRLLSWVFTCEKQAVSAQEESLRMQHSKSCDIKQAKHPLDLFFQVARGAGAYILKKTEYSHLSMKNEAELWRALVLEYPEIVSYLFNEDSKETLHLYTFFKSFYANHWHQEMSLGGKIWEKFHENPFVKKVKGCSEKSSSAAAKNPPARKFEDADKSDVGSSDQDDAAFFEEFEPLEFCDDTPKVPGITWLLDRQERAAIAQWLAVTGSQDCDRVAFAELVKGISRLPRDIWEERALYYISFGMLPFFNQNKQLRKRLLSLPRRRSLSGTTRASDHFAAAFLARRSTV